MSFLLIFFDLCGYNDFLLCFFTIVLYGVLLFVSFSIFFLFQNDVSEIPDLTFSMDADEEKLILYEKNEVRNLQVMIFNLNCIKFGYSSSWFCKIFRTYDLIFLWQISFKVFIKLSNIFVLVPPLEKVTDYELKPGGRNIRVTEETKHEYVDLVAEHILTNAIRPQINSFLEGFNELVPRELISIFNDKELELLISGLPEIDCKLAFLCSYFLHCACGLLNKFLVGVIAFAVDDLKANAEYTGYTAASSVIQWFWEVVTAFNKEDMARLLQFVTGTSKVMWCSVHKMLI